MKGSFLQAIQGEEHVGASNFRPRSQHFPPWPFSSVVLSPFSFHTWHMNESIDLSFKSATSNYCAKDEEINP